MLLRDIHFVHVLIKDATLGKVYMHIVLSQISLKIARHAHFMNVRPCTSSYLTG